MNESSGAPAGARYILGMKSLSTKELQVMVENVVAKRIVRGTVKPVHMVVVTRLQNALAIEDSIKALNEVSK